MRIISGTLRGKNLLTPQNWDTRPTSDKARQGVFNILEHAEFPNGFSGGLYDKNVIDVFAGTGAMGLEALSRGAKFAAFVENNHNALKVIEENIKACRFEDNSKILRQDASKILMLPKTLPKFDLVFLDPPYGKNLLEPALLGLKNGGWLAENAILIAEAKKGEDFTPPDSFEILRQINYGINAFWIMSLN